MFKLMPDGKTVGTNIEQMAGDEFAVWLDLYQDVTFTPGARLTSGAGGLSRCHRLFSKRNCPASKSNTAALMDDGDWNFVPESDTAGRAEQLPPALPLPRNLREAG
jgi:hypothetical protein